MALSGTFQNYPVSSFGLYCEWSGAQSVTANYTDVTLKVYLSYYTLDVGREATPPSLSTASAKPTPYPPSRITPAAGKRSC